MSIYTLLLTYVTEMLLMCLGFTEAILLVQTFCQLHISGGEWYIWHLTQYNNLYMCIAGLKNAELVLSIKKKKLAYNGHVRRHHSLQKLVLEGKVDGKRGRGRRGKIWTGNVSEMTKMSMAQCSVKTL